jgi:hypothetical protein
VTATVFAACLTLGGCASAPAVKVDPPDDEVIARDAIAGQLAKIPRCSQDVRNRASPTVNVAQASSPQLSLIRGHLEIRGGYGCEPNADLCSGPWLFVPAAAGQEAFLLSPRHGADPYLWEVPEGGLGALKAHVPLLEVIVDGRPDRRPVTPGSHPLAARELWFDSLCAVGTDGRPGP